MSPIYEFRCPNCGIKIEQRREIDSASPHPMCGDCLVTMEKTYSPIGVVFKGDGWANKK